MNKIKEKRGVHLQCIRGKEKCTEAQKFALIGRLSALKPKTMHCPPVHNSAAQKGQCTVFGGVSAFFLGLMH